MKLKKVFIGIDVSKKKLDVTVVEDPNSKKHHHFIVSNCKEGIAEIFTKTKALGIKKKQLVICFEHTGVYTMPLCFYLQQKDIEYSMVPAIEIYRSRGWHNLGAAPESLLLF
jgi:transposase